MAWLCRAKVELCTGAVESQIEPTDRELVYAKEGCEEMTKHPRMLTLTF